MHENVIELLDAGSTEEERNRRKAIARLTTAVSRGTFKPDDLVAAFQQAGDAMIKFGEALVQPMQIVVDSIGAMANKLKPVVDLLVSDNFDELTESFAANERETLRKIRAALLKDHPDLLRSKDKRGSGRPPRQPMLAKGRIPKRNKQHQRRRR